MVKPVVLNKPVSPTMQRVVCNKRDISRETQNLHVQANTMHSVMFRTVPLGLYRCRFLKSTITLKT